MSRSFRGEALEGADFAGEDLRGADFTAADLRSADFRRARFGMSPRVGLAVLATGLVVAVAAGVAIGWSVDQTRDRLSADQWDEVAEGGSIGFVLVVLVALILWRGFDFAFKVAGAIYLVVLALQIVANLVWEEFEWLAAVRATAIVIFLVLAILAGILGRLVGGVFGAWSVALVAVSGGLASGQAEGGVAGVVVAVSLAIISKRALRGDQRDRTLRQVAHLLVRRWGTRFVDADLSGADFSGTDASQSDIRGANLADVTWDPDYPLPMGTNGET